MPYKWGPSLSKLRHKPRPPTFRRNLSFPNWKLGDAAYVIMGQCIGQNGDNVEAGLKGSREWDCEKSMENHVINCSTRVWLLPISQHLFFNTSNLVTSLYHQYLDTTSEQLRSSLSADEHSWIVSCRARNSRNWVLFPVSAPGRGLMPVGYVVVPLRLQGGCRIRERAGLISTQTCTLPRAGNNKCAATSSLDGLWSSLSHSFLCSLCLRNTSKIPT